MSVEIWAPIAAGAMGLVLLNIAHEIRKCAKALQSIADTLQPGNLSANIYDCTYDAGNKAGGYRP